MPRRNAPQESGTIYVTSWGATYTQPVIDAEKIAKISDNVYLAGALDKQQRTLFKDKKEFEVRGVDPEGEPDKDLSERLTSMCLAKDVDLWFNLQIAWRESAIWGPAIFNPVWDDVDGEYSLIKLRHLPSESFSSAGTNYSRIKNPLLPGICVNEKTEEIEFWQKQVDGRVIQLENVVMMSDPVRSGQVGGKPLILPIIPVLNMMDFTWKGRMQQENRLGGGGLFALKITSPKKDDKKYAQTILKNISRGVAFQLRENMEVVNLGINETATASNTIDALDRLISDYFSPASSISKDGTLIGGSSSPEYDLYLSYIQGQQAWVETSFERLLDPYLLNNGYEEWSIIVDIPEPTIDRSQFFVAAAESAYRTQSISLNERRAIYTKAGIELPELEDEEKSKLKEEYVGPAMDMDRARLAVEAAKIDELDQFSAVDKKTQREVIHKALGRKAE
jgi:hypothetical protein